jgi:hypothetical protein
LLAISLRERQSLTLQTADGPLRVRLTLVDDDRWQEKIGIEQTLSCVEHGDSVNL